MDNANAHYGEDYLTKFDVSAYLKTGWEEIGKPILALWHNAVSETSVNNARLLDIGTGPCLLSLACVSRLCDSITLSDYVPANRDQLRKWIQREEGAYDWTGVFQTAADLEGNGTTAANIEERLRRSIVPDILTCDVHKENPVERATTEPFDIITTQLCLEAACISQDQYQKAVQNISGLLKPGGILFQVGVVSESFYYVGDALFRIFPVSLETAQQAITSAGFEDLNVQTYTYENLPKEWGGRKIIFCIRAKKKAA